MADIPYLRVRIRQQLIPAEGEPPLTAEVVDADDQVLGQLPISGARYKVAVAGFSRLRLDVLVDSADVTTFDPRRRS